jgi:hypothetical protein
MAQSLRWVGGIISLLAIFTFCSCGGAASEHCKAGNNAVKITDLGDKLKVEINGKLFTEYVYKDAAQPHFYPLVGPTGEIICRRWPVEPNMDGKYEQHDHPAHIGLWFGHMVNGNVRFWCGGKVHEKFLEISSGNIGVIKAENKWVTEANEVVCTSTNTYEIRPLPEGETLLDCEIEIHASNGPVTFNDSKEGTMAIRLATSMAQNLNSKSLGNPKFRFEREPGEEGGHIINSDGVTDANAFGKKAAWCDYHGPLKGQTVGVAIFDNPKNVNHPAGWMVRDYGLFAANPFGISELGGKKGETAGQVVIPAGGRLSLKYRFYFHKGDEKQAKVAELYKQYASADCPKAAKSGCPKSAMECVKQ